MDASLSRSRLLWSFARPHLPTLAFGLLLALLGSGMALVSPLVTKWVLDSLAVGGSLQQPILVLIGLLIVGAAVSLWQWTLLGTLAEEIVLRARTRLVDRFLGARIGAITSQPTGELVTRVTSDSLLLREAASSALIGLINGAIMLLGSLVLMGFLDLPLLSTTLVAVSIVVALFVTLMPAIGKAQEQSQASLGRLGGALESSLRAIRTVKASRAEARQAASIRVLAEETKAFSVRAVRRSALAWVIAFSGLQLAIIVILGVGASRVAAGALEVSSLIAFLLYAFGLMGPIMEISQNLTALQSGLAAAARIRDIELLPQEADTPRLATPTIVGAVGIVPAPAAEPPVVELRDVSFTYDGALTPAVRDFSLAIPARGHLALVGPSGAGKTTTLSLIMRFIEPTSGELRLLEQPYAALSHDAVRVELAYVEQETPLVPGTIRENLTIAHPDAAEAELWAALDAVRLTDKVRTLPDGLDTNLQATELSGGQRQRLALARAIVRRPRLLLLDEATAQVDGITEQAIQRVIRDRAATGTVVTIAHRLSTVIDADQILVMEDGQVRARGTHDELLATDELYRELIAALRIGEHGPSAAAEPALAGAA